MNKTLTKLGSSQKQVTDILEFFQAEEVELSFDFTETEIDCA